MNKYEKNLFFDVPDDAGGGGDQQQQQQSQAPAGPQFDAEALGRSLGPVLAEHSRSLLTELRQDQPPSSEQLAQMRKELKVWEPDDNWYANFDNIEKRKEAVAQMRDGLFGQAFTATQKYYAEREQALRAEFSPALQFIARHEAEQQMGRFHTDYPVLAKLSPVVQAVAQDFRARGQKFADESSLFKAIATGVEAVMKTTNPEFKLTAAGAAQPQRNNGTALPTTTPGGGGGGGNGGGNSTGKSKLAQVLG